MSDTNQILVDRWTRKRAALLAVVCLLGGIAGGWFIRGSQSPVAALSANVASVNPMAEVGAGPAPQTQSPARSKEMADAQAEPMLDRLKLDANNPELLAGIGNIYYDAQQYPIAIDYYRRALKAKPTDAAVRTDLATAFWYMGDADTAIAEFNRALIDAPNNPNTLFNRGLVKQQGKKDSAGALADWEKLLAANPNYEAKGKVVEMIAEAKRQREGKP